MSSIFSTQKRQTFLRRKYCFLPTAAALSPPVGRWFAAMGLAPLVGSGMFSSPSLLLRVPGLPPERRARGEQVQQRQAGQRERQALVRPEWDARLPLRRPTSAGQATVAAPRAADAGARASRVP